MQAISELLSDDVDGGAWDGCRSVVAVLPFRLVVPGYGVEQRSDLGRSLIDVAMRQSQLCRGLRKRPSTKRAADCVNGGRGK